MSNTTLSVNRAFCAALYIVIYLILAEDAALQSVATPRKGDGVCQLIERLHMPGSSFRVNGYMHIMRAVLPNAKVSGLLHGFIVGVAAVFVATYIPVLRVRLHQAAPSHNPSSWYERHLSHGITKDRCAHL